MSSTGDATEALRAALAVVAGLDVRTDPSASFVPPGCLVAAPTLTWASFCNGPESATYPVVLMVAASEQAQSQLDELVLTVADAIHEVRDAIVRTATPGFYVVGGSDLPCYNLSVEMSLQ